MAKMTNPANPEQLEMDQMAEIESDRLLKQVRGETGERRIQTGVTVCDGVK